MAVQGNIWRYFVSWDKR